MIFGDYFKDQGKRVIKNFRSQFIKSIKQFEDITSDEVVKLIFDIDEENEELVKTIKPLHTSGVIKGVSDVNSISRSRVNANISNPFIKRAIDRLGEKIEFGITKEGNRFNPNFNTQKEFSRRIGKLIDDGASVNEIQDFIQDKYDQFSIFRARRIARTEARIAWDTGSHLAYQELGVKKVDVVGCTDFAVDIGGTEINSDCGRQDVPIAKVPLLQFHPNHIGVLAPSEEI